MQKANITLNYFCMGESLTRRKLIPLTDEDANGPAW